jgi:hypothetical protein
LRLADIVLFRTRRACPASSTAEASSFASGERILARACGKRSQKSRVQNDNGIVNDRATNALGCALRKKPNADEIFLP